MRTYFKTSWDQPGEEIFVKKFFSAEAEANVETALRANGELVAERLSVEFEELSKKTDSRILGDYLQDLGLNVQDGEDVYEHFLRGADGSFNLKQVIIDGISYIPVITWEGCWDVDQFNISFSNVELVEAESFEVAAAKLLHQHIKHTGAEVDPDNAEMHKIAKGCYEYRINHATWEETFYIFHACCKKAATDLATIYEMPEQEA